MSDESKIEDTLAYKVGIWLGMLAMCAILWIGVIWLAKQALL